MSRARYFKKDIVSIEIIGGEFCRVEFADGDKYWSGGGLINHITADLVLETVWRDNGK